MKKYIQQNKRVVVVLVAVPVIVIMGFLFGLVYTGSTKEIVAVANQFQPDPSWTLESEKITPPRIICIDSVCPQVVRSWVLKDIDADALSMIFKSNYEAINMQEDDCKISNNSGSLPICSFRAMSGGYSVDLTVWSDRSDKSLAVLTVNKE